MTISTRWIVHGPTMRQEALTPKAQARRTCEVPWYQRLGVVLVVAVGIIGQIVALWTIGQILRLWLGA